MQLEIPTASSPDRAASQRPGPGAVIGGKYQLETQLGEGGMGSVWRARNVTLDLPVALKLLHPELSNAQSTSRLLNEARAEAKLSHPSIVRVFDFGETEQHDAYIVMELLEGINLAQVLDEHRALPASYAVRLLLPIVHGLCAAHGAGVVHRDIKPENILIAKAGSHLQPKLLDFGIAKLNGDRAARGETSGSDLFGSPGYMAPEQVCGLDDVDERADVWALCLVLYELISGQNPFAAPTQVAVLCAIMQRDVQPLAAAGCEQLWPILRRGLAKDREQRHASARELGDALARWLVSAYGELEDACGEPLAWNWNVRASQAADAQLWNSTWSEPPLETTPSSEAIACPRSMYSTTTLRITRPDRELGVRSRVARRVTGFALLSIAVWVFITGVPGAHSANVNMLRAQALSMLPSYARLQSLIRIPASDALPPESGKQPASE